MFSDPPAGNSGEKPGMGPERAGGGRRKYLGKSALFVVLSSFVLPFCRSFGPSCLLFLCVFLTPLYTYRFCLLVLFLRLCDPAQVPGPPPFINTSCPGVSRVRVPGCPGAGPVTVSRGVPGSCVPGCSGLSRPPPRDKKAFSSYLAFWDFILALPFLESGFCLGGALAYRGSIPPGAAVVFLDFLLPIFTFNQNSAVEFRA